MGNHFIRHHIVWDMNAVNCSTRVFPVMLVLNISNLNRFQFWSPCARMYSRTYQAFGKWQMFVSCVTLPQFAACTSAVLGKRPQADSTVLCSLAHQCRRGDLCPSQQSSELSFLLHCSAVHFQGWNKRQYVTHCCIYPEAIASQDSISKYCMYYQVSSAHFVIFMTGMTYVGVIQRSTLKNKSI